MKEGVFTDFAVLRSLLSLNTTSLLFFTFIQSRCFDHLTRLR